MVVVRTLKDIMSFQLKNRNDGYCDQFNRIFMTKVLLISSVIMGAEYFSDQVNCMIPENAQHPKDFFQAACWISGFYIFEEMKTRLDKSGYFGIPLRVDYDGINEITNELCHTSDQFEENQQCRPMTRLYFLHYQWMPVYIASLGMFFYFPYICFRIANSDLIALKKEIKKSSSDARVIIRNYFNYSANSLCQLRVRIWWNIIVKLLYLIFALIAFKITDHVLLGKYFSYGRDYLNWYQQNNTQRYIGVPKGVQAHAGNVLLPSMGYCDVHEASFETRVTFHNENRFICEISPHVLYQYILMVLWFCFVASMVISLIGLFSYLFCNLCDMIPLGKSLRERTIIKNLTLREIEYLEVIKKRNLVKYGDVLRTLKEERFDVDADNETRFSDQIDHYINTIANR